MKKQTEPIIRMQEMQDWIHYLDINNRYQGDEIKYKCIMFIFLWMQFNEYYNLKYSTISGGDKIKAIQISKEVKFIYAYENSKEKIISDFKNIHGADSPRTWIYNYHKNKKELFTESNYTPARFLEIIYIIRGNLFHGDKPPVDTNIKIIEWAYTYLYKLLNESEIIHY